MKTVKQLIRQPVKTLAGIFLAALAVAVLITCVGQYTAAGLTRTNLDDRYDTVAVISDQYFWNRTPGQATRLTRLPEEIRSWITDTIETREDLIQAVSCTDLFSAYVPGLRPDNFSHYENGNSMKTQHGSPTEQAAYRGAMLEVTLTKVGTHLAEDVSTFTRDGESKTMLNSTTVLCTGTVDRVICLEPGFRSPVGRQIVLLITAYTREDLQALDLRAGEKYLVYGMDYSDLQGTALETTVITYQPGFEELYGIALYDRYGRSNIDSITRSIDCCMTVCDYSALPWNYISGEGFVTLTDMRKFYTRSEDQIHVTSVPAEEYIPNYQVPTIVKLEGTAEDFLESPDGALWQQVLKEMDISHHGFPVLAVDKLGYQITFARDQARIVAGRDFTESERTGGGKVCILSETVAAANGLKVGDTIHMRTYGYDLNIQVQQRELRYSTSFPGAAVYSRAQGFTSDTESYTIVGLYRQNDAWQNSEDPYGITPNTIFVPKNAMAGNALVGKSGIFYTVVLHNGKMDAFRQYQEAAGYPDLFICMDRGYGEVLTGLDAYEEVSSQAFSIGIVGCVAIMTLFLILFPLRQGKTLATMCSLGASRWKRMGYVIGAALCLLIPGTAMGGLAGYLLWERLAAALMAAVNVQISLEENMALLAPCLAAGMLLLSTAAVFLASAAISGSAGPMRKK